MRELTAPIGQCFFYTMKFLLASGQKVGGYIPIWEKEEREQVMINTKPMTKKDFEEKAFDGITYEFALKYCEEKGCDVFVRAIYENVSPDEILIQKLKQGIRKQSFIYDDFGNLEIADLGLNEPFCIAKALDIVKEYKISEKQVIKALNGNANQYGIKATSKKPLVIEDTVVNAEMASELTRTLDKYFEGQPRVFVAGFGRIPELSEACEMLFKDAFQILTYHLPLHNDALSAFDLAYEIRNTNMNVTETGSPEEAMELAKMLVSGGGIIIKVN